MKTQIRVHSPFPNSPGTIFLYPIPLPLHFLARPAAWDMLGFHRLCQAFLVHFDENRFFSTPVSNPSNIHGCGRAINRTAEE